MNILGFEINRESFKKNYKLILILYFVITYFGSTIVMDEYRIKKCFYSNVGIGKVEISEDKADEVLDDGFILIGTESVRVSQADIECKKSFDLWSLLFNKQSLTLVFIGIMLITFLTLLSLFLKWMIKPWIK